MDDRTSPVMQNDPNDGLSKTMKLGIIWDNGLGALKSFGLKLDNELRLTVVSAGGLSGCLERPPKCSAADGSPPHGSKRVNFVPVKPPIVSQFAGEAPRKSS